MRYFTMAELAASAEAARHRIDNTPPPGPAAKLAALTDNLLDPIRERWGWPIGVNSGYRCPQLNHIVGGVGSSQHLRGEAADITAGSAAQNRKLFGMIAEGGFDFDQLIDESGYRWIHISYSAGRNRRQILHL